MIIGERLFKKLVITKYARIKTYLEILENECNIHKLSSSEKKTVTNIKFFIGIKIKKVKAVTYLNLFFYFGLYFGVVSLFFTDLIFFGIVTEVVGRIIGIFGSSLFILGIFISGKLEDLYYSDLFLLTSHLISIYNIVGFKNKEGLFSEKNKYDSFVKFFKERGYREEY